MKKTDSVTPLKTHLTQSRDRGAGRRRLALVLCTCAVAPAFSNSVLAQSPIAGLLSELPGVNSTQSSMGFVIEEACPSFSNEAAFQARCTAVVLRALQGPQGTSEVLNALQRVAPEQIISQGTEATRTATNVIGARLSALRLGVTGVSLVGWDGIGSPLAASGLASQSERGGAAGDDPSSPWNRLGVFVNGSYQFGDVDTTFNQLGFDFDSGGVTAGADYRFTQSLIFGVAFTYLRMESDFDRSGGELDSDTYAGSIYGTFYPTDNFYVDGIASIGGIDYESARRISYTVPGDTVNTAAISNPDGRQYAASIGAGYNLPVGALTLDPYVRINYINLDIDGFSEQGGDGWAMQFEDQTVESLTSSLGTQLQYAMSLPWGVLQPYVRGEWRHEFEDDGRIIPVRFLGNTTNNLAFSTVTESPDRNYFTVGAGVSATFARGVSAFVDYDALLGYDDIESHAFMVGTRMEF